MPVKTVRKKAAAPPAMDEGVRKELMELVRNNEHLFPEHSTRLLLLKYPPSRRAGILEKLREMDGLGDLEVPDDDTEEAVLLELREAQGRLRPDDLVDTFARITSGIGLQMTQRRSRDLQRMVDRDLKEILGDDAPDAPPRAAEPKRSRPSRPDPSAEPATSQGYFLGCCPAMLVRVRDWAGAPQAAALRRAVSAVSRDSICLWCREVLEPDGGCACRCHQCKRSRPACVAAALAPGAVDPCLGFFPSSPAYRTFATGTLREFREMTRAYLFNSFEVPPASLEAMVRAQVAAYRDSGMVKPASPLRTVLNAVPHEAACPFCNTNFLPKNGTHGFCPACRMHPPLREMLQRILAKPKPAPQ